jgi:hypothetical protein
VARSSIGSKAGSWKGKVRRDLSCKTDKQTQDNQLDRIDTDSLTENTDRQERVLPKSGIYSYKVSERIREKCRTCHIFFHILYTVMPLRCITVALFPVWKWDRGQLLFNAKEIESASCEAENC